MANEEHLKILKQGIAAWNQWRDKWQYVYADLSKQDFSNLSLRYVNFYHTDFNSSLLVGADLVGSNFTMCVFGNADLSGATLGGAKFGRASLRMARLGGATLYGADLSEADLTGAEFQGAHLQAVNLNGAILEGANLAGAVIERTVFAAVDLSAVKGLDQVFHRGPSSIDIETIYKSEGNIPEVFLRGAGVPEDFIVYMKSLAGKPIEFYSCFISHSSKDDDFARRLHADLQQNNVRVWFAPEDLKIGDKFRTRIDESIRIYDKLMVVLSANSIQSPWVEEEVETALEKERRKKKLVLFPIRLDDAVIDTEQAWAASLRRTRHIGDFRNWKDHDSFKKAFARLLRDLKAVKAVASDK